MSKVKENLERIRVRMNAAAEEEDRLLQVSDSCDESLELADKAHERARAFQWVLELDWGED